MKNCNSDYVRLSVFNKICFIIFICLLIVFLICFKYGKQDHLTLGYFTFMSALAFAFSSGCHRCGRSNQIDFFMHLFSSWRTPCRYCDGDDVNQISNKAWQNKLASYFIYNCGRAIILSASMEILGIIVVQLVFPDIYWFHKLYTAIGVSAFLSLVIILIFKRKLIKPTQEPDLFNLKFKLNCFWICLIIIFLFVFTLAEIPNFIKIERQLKIIRNLSVSELSSVMLKDKEIHAPEKLSRFTKSCFKAGLFYPNHEFSGDKFKVTISLQNGKKMSFDACVYNNHRNDIVLLFHTPPLRGKILLPNASDLLVFENQPQVKKTDQANRKTPGPWD